MATPQYTHEYRPGRTAFTCRICQREFWLTPCEIEHGGGEFCNKACWKQRYGTIDERLEANKVIDPETGCWLWTGYRNNTGYGLTRLPNGINTLVTRLSAQKYLGLDIDSDVCVLHKCDNPQCFNPEHLFLGSHADNVQDMMSKGRNVSHSGQKNGAAKLTDEQVKEIRAYCKEHKKSQAYMAKVHGVHPSLIKRILDRTAWKHVP